MYIIMFYQLGLTPLLDNDPKDRYYYEVIVSTGMRRGAGTESKVFAILLHFVVETKNKTWDKLLEF